LNEGYRDLKALKKKGPTNHSLGGYHPRPLVGAGLKGGGGKPNSFQMVNFSEGKEIQRDGNSKRTEKEKDGISNRSWAGNLWILKEP